MRRDSGQHESGNRGRFAEKTTVITVNFNVDRRACTYILLFIGHSNWSQAGICWVDAKSRRRVRILYLGRVRSSFLCLALSRMETKEEPFEGYRRFHGRSNSLCFLFAAARGSASHITRHAGRDLAKARCVKCRTLHRSLGRRCAGTGCHHSAALDVL